MDDARAKNLIDSQSNSRMGNQPLGLIFVTRSEVTRDITRNDDQTEGNKFERGGQWTNELQPEQTCINHLMMTNRGQSC